MLTNISMLASSLFSGCGCKQVIWSFLCLNWSRDVKVMLQNVTSLSFHRLDPDELINPSGWGLERSRFMIRYLQTEQSLCRDLTFCFSGHDGTNNWFIKPTCKVQVCVKVLISERGQRSRRVHHPTETLCRWFNWMQFSTVCIMSWWTNP